MTIFINFVLCICAIINWYTFFVCYKRWFALVDEVWFSKQYISLCFEMYKFVIIRAILWLVLLVLSGYVASYCSFKFILFLIHK